LAVGDHSHFLAKGSTMNRRSLLATWLGAGGALLSALVAVPALLSVGSPLWRKRSGEAWRAVGPLEDFPVGQVTKGIVQVDRGDWANSLEVKAVYVWRKSAAETVVFSRNCTDLSCPVHFDSGSECFFCPCHGGIFAKDGTPMAGPPRVPLYRYQNRLRDGVLEIDLYSLPPMT
jgi:menaquinol-cytochrome c reductase iron-sulfur subunit